MRQVTARPGSLWVRNVALTVLALLASALPVNAEPAAEIESKVASALEVLYAAEPGTQELAENSAGVLIFPDIVKGGVILGGQYGEGALRVDGRTRGYFSIAAVSYGLQVGAQQFGYAIFFLNEDALDQLDDSQGFELGVGPTLVGGDEGWSASMGTKDLQGDVAVVFFGQAGLMAGGSIEGSKITPIER